MRHTLLLFTGLLLLPGLPGLRAEEEAKGDPLEQRYLRLTELLVCACADENWTRTLHGCPDPCANPQKKEVRALLEEGSSDEEVLSFMEAKYGPKVIATTPFAGIHTAIYLVPILLLLVGAYVIVSYLRRRTGGEAPAPAPAEEDDRWREKLDAELEDMV